MLVISEENYLAINGAGRQEYGESALHKNRGNNSDKQWKKLVERQLKKDIELTEKRERLRKEYLVKVEQGELRPPTRIEHLISIARGHEDNTSVQAARNLLTKKGIDWTL